jgi:glycosyltransferase involved in cell wall biosynthesis
MTNDKATDKKDVKKLICYRGDRAACWFYRLHAPMVHIGKHNKNFDITVSSSIGPDHIGKYDLAILQRQYRFEVLDPVTKMQKGGTKLIYEIDDDLFHIPKWNPAHDVLSRKAVQDGIKHFLARVDAMFVTTEELREVYKDHCEHIYVLPNSIEFNFIFPPKDKNTLKPVVCWQGSMTHEKDLAIARKSFERLAADKDIFLKMWCGLDHETKKPVFNIPGAETLPLTPFEGFFQMFGQLGVHIGLAPLAAIHFNKSKSNLKFLEYTAYDAVTVASNFGPYKNTIEDGVTGILVSDNRDWYCKVRELIEDVDRYNYILSNAKKLVKEKYDIKNNYVLWEEAIKKVLGE